jgi:1-acyl-sn-glycerol-3-phosphate acyltransferase
MLNFLPSLLIGIISSLLFGLNVLFWPVLVFFLSILKFILPFSLLRRLFDQILIWFAENWIACNSGWMRLTQKTKWDVQGREGLNYHGWYLVVGNHQSWVDIFVLQHLLNRRIPFMKFFLKRELIWVPIMGIAWWALDFPFLRRHSAEYLKKHPAQKGKDFATTRLACEKCIQAPTSVMNFPEGTRITEAKRLKKGSPYQYLLCPRTGGMALALNILGDRFHSLLDITIVYPDGIPNFWEFLCGKVKRVIVRIQQVEVPPQLLHSVDADDPVFRDAVNRWVNQLWREKDVQIQSLRKDSGSI